MNYSNRKCPICASEKKEFLEFLINKIDNKDFFYVICKTCGMMYLDSSYHHDKIQDIYMTTHIGKSQRILVCLHGCLLEAQE
jgi:hypothetical protein